MKILVCISNVPDTTTKITFSDDNSKFNENGVQFIINPNDEIALASAIEIAEAQNGEVTVIHVGEATSEPTIRKALAIGAAKAVRVNAKPRDAYFVASQIAAYVKSNPFDLILTGSESIDYNGSLIAGMVGELLDIPSVSIIKSLKIENQKAIVEREIEGGKETLEINLPLIVGTAEGVSEPKLPNMRGIMSARTKPLEVVDAIEVEQKSQIIRYDTPAPRSAVKLFGESEIEQLVALLRSEAKVI